MGMVVMIRSRLVNNLSNLAAFTVHTVKSASIQYCAMTAEQNGSSVTHMDCFFTYIWCNMPLWKPPEFAERLGDSTDDIKQLFNAVSSHVWFVGKWIPSQLHNWMHSTKMCPPHLTQTLWIRGASTSLALREHYLIFVVEHLIFHKNSHTCLI